MHVEHVLYKVIVLDVLVTGGQATLLYHQVSEHEIVIPQDYKGLFEIVGVEIIAPSK